MTLYADASAFVKRHASHEPDHAACVETMDSHPEWVTSRLTLVEAPRAFARLDDITGTALVAEFDHEATATAFIDVDHGIVALARAVAIETGIKTLDAIHIASAKQLPVDDLEFLTYDDRQASAAEALGLRLAR